MKKMWRFVWVSSPVLTTILSLGNVGFAIEKPVAAEIDESLILGSSQTTSDNLNQEAIAAQVTSVVQLSDVQSTDWAFQALQSLIERYGCIAGYPNRTFQGNSKIIRSEFATGLNACLNQMSELITNTNTDLVTKEDLTKLQKLQEQFSAELAILRSRVNVVETHTSELAAHQFSTTTTLNGEVVVALIGIVAGENANGEKIDRNPILAEQVRLNFESSFTGKDLLRTRLQASNLNAFSGTSTFTPQGDLQFAGGAFDSSEKNSVGLDQLLYQFPVGEKITITVNANAGTLEDFTNTVNSFCNVNDDGVGALSHFGSCNPIYYLGNGTGLGIHYELSKNLEISLGYLANDAANFENKSGLFNGPYGAIAQLTVKPSDTITIGLTYVNSYNNDFTAGGSAGSNRANLRSALANNPNLPNSLSPFSGVELPISSNSYGVEASFQISPKFILGGWVGYTNTHILAPISTENNETIPEGGLDIWNYAVTLAFPDLGKDGNLGGIIVGMEPKVTDVSNSLKDIIGKDQDTSLHVEGFYQYHLSDNISITPGIIWLTAPDDNSKNAGIVIGTLRTTFTF